MSVIQERRRKVQATIETCDLSENQWDDIFWEKRAKRRYLKIKLYIEVVLSQVFGSLLSQLPAKLMNRAWGRLPWGRPCIRNYPIIDTRINSLKLQDILKVQSFLFTEIERGFRNSWTTKIGRFRITYLELHVHYYSLVFGSFSRFVATVHEYDSRVYELMRKLRWKIISSIFFWTEEIINFMTLEKPFLRI